MNSTRVDKTKIFPLRWFANGCNYLGTPHLVKMFDLQENGVTSGLRWRFHGFMWDWTYAVYKKWGTYYKLHIDDLLNDPVLDRLGSDYDEHGIPYWDYDWHEDPITGDAWRIVKL